MSLIYYNNGQEIDLSLGNILGVETKKLSLSSVSSYCTLGTQFSAYTFGNLIIVFGPIQITTSVPTRTTFVSIIGATQPIENEYGGLMSRNGASPHRLRSMNNQANIDLQPEDGALETGWYNLIYIIYV